MLSFDENSIRTENGSVVMHSWETPIMQEMCKWVCKRGAKADVLETFGAPNITTRDSSGNEVWTYQRQAQVSQSSSSSGFIFVIIAGKSAEASGFETSSKMMTLIIKFDGNDIVTDFKSRESNF